MFGRLFGGARVGLIPMCIMLAFAASPAIAGLTYNFDDGTMQGWTTVMADPGAPFQARPNVNGFGPQAGGYLMGGGWDNETKTNWVRSPEFKLDGTGDLTFWLGAGHNRATLPGYDSGVPTDTIPDGGFMGVALRRVSDGAFVLQSNRTTDDAWAKYSFTQAQIAPYVGSGAYTLDFIDYDRGGWGWIAMDSVSVPGNLPFYNWAGTALDHAWNTTPTNTNWLDEATPVAFADGKGARFSDDAEHTTVNLDTANVIPREVRFDNITKDYVLTGAYGIAGAASLTKSGGGKLTILNNNSYTGPTTINAGTVQVGNGGTSGSLGTGAITLAGGANLNLNRSDEVILPSRVGTIKGAGNVTKDNSNTLYLNVDPAGMTGTVAVTGGTLKLGTDWVPGLTEGYIDGAAWTGRPTYPGTWNATPVLSPRAGYTQTKDGSPWADNRTIVYKGQFNWQPDVSNTGNLLTFGWSIDDNCQVWIDGQQWVTDGAPWSGVGTHAVTPGWHNIEVRFANGGGGVGPGGRGASADFGFGYDPLGRNQGGDNLNNPDPVNFGQLTKLIDPGSGTLLRGTQTFDRTVGPIVMSNSAALDLNGNNAIAASLAGSAGTVVALGKNTLTVGSGNTNTTYEGTITGTAGGAFGKVTKVGTGLWTLTGANTYAGATTVNGGNGTGGLSVSADNNLGTGSSLTLSGNSVLQITGAAAFNSGKALNIGAGGATIQVDNTAGATFSVAPTGTASLTKTGAERLTLGQYSGPVSVSNGALKLSSVGLPGLAVQSWTAIDTKGNDLTAITAWGTTPSDTWRQTSPINYAQIDRQDQQWVAEYGLVENGRYIDNFATQWKGKLFIPAAGTYTFWTSSDDGSGIWIDDAANNPNGMTNALVDNNGAHGPQDRSGTFTATEPGYHDFLVRFEEGGGGHSVIVDWQRPEAGSVREHIPASQFFILPPGAPSMGPITISATGVVDLNGTDASVASLAGEVGSQVLLGANKLTIGTGNTSTVFQGVFTGTGAVEKTGTGTLTLTTAQDYSADTRVNGGTLKLDANMPGSMVYVGPGTLHAANGITVNGLIMNASGTLKMGADTVAGARLTISSGGLALNPGSILNFKFDKVAPSATHDKVIFTDPDMFTSNGDATNRVLVAAYDIDPGTGAKTNFGTIGRYDLIDYDTFVSLPDFPGYTPNKLGFIVTNPVPGRRYTFEVTVGAPDLSGISARSLDLVVGPGPMWQGITDDPAGSGDYKWSTAGNWDPAPQAGNPPLVSYDLLTFDTNAGLKSVNDQSIVGFLGLYFGSNAGAFTLSGNGLDLYGDVDKNVVTNNAPDVLQTINLPITLKAEGAINAAAGPLAFGGTVNYGTNQLTVKGAKDTRFSGDVQGSGQLIKADSGKLILEGVDKTYSGNTTVNGGSLQVDARLLASNVFVKPGATLSGTGTVNQITTLDGTTGNPAILQGGASPLNLTTLVARGAANTLSSGVVNVSGALTLNAGGGLTVSSGATLNVPNLAPAGKLDASSGGVWVSNQYQSALSGRLTVTADPAKPFGLSGADLSLGADVTLKGGTTTITVNALAGPSEGLLGYWNFDNSNSNDISGHGYNGTAVGGPAYSTDTHNGIGKSLLLNGNSQYVKVDTGGSQSVFDGGTAITISAWVKGWPGTWNPFVSKNGEPNGWQMRRHGGDNTLDWTDRGLNANGGSDFPSNTTIVADGQWHLVTMSYDGATRKIYVDGTLDATRADTATIAASTSMMVFGARDNGGIGSYFTGSLDDIRFYNRALSATEVGALYNGSVAYAPTSVNVAEVSTLNTSLTNAMPGAGLELGDLNIAADLTLGNAGISFRNVNATATSSINGSAFSIRGGMKVDPATTELTVVADLLGSNKVIKIGGGTLVLPNAKTFSGTMTLNGGTLRLGDANALANARLGATGAGGTLDIPGGTANVVGLVGNGPLTLPVGATVNVGAGTANSTFFGTLGGAANLNKVGGGEQAILGSLSAPGTLSGKIDIAAPGSLTLSPVGVAPADVTVHSGATLRLVASPVSRFGEGWTFNGSATASTNQRTLTLTPAVNGMTGSAYFTDKVPVAAFSASFVYQGSGSTQGDPADGATIVLQTQGLNALGGGGGALGYEGITPSAALAINVYNGHVIGTNVFTNGNIQGSTYVSSAPVDPRSGHAVRVDMSVAGTALSEDLTDLVTGATYHRDVVLPADLPTLLGGSHAYLGFTGATGGLNVQQTISNFSFNMPGMSTVVVSKLTGDGTVDLNGATLNLQTSENPMPEFGGTIINGPSGIPGNLMKSGAGTLNLATASVYQYTGATTVTEGMLNVNATIPTTAVNALGGTMNVNAPLPTAISARISGATLNLNVDALSNATLTSQGGALGISVPLANVAGLTGTGKLDLAGPGVLAVTVPAGAASGSTLSLGGTGGLKKLGGGELFILGQGGTNSALVDVAEGTLHLGEAAVGKPAVKVAAGAKLALVRSTGLDTKGWQNSVGNDLARWGELGVPRDAWITDKDLAANWNGRTTPGAIQYGDKDGGWGPIGPGPAQQNWITEFTPSGGTWNAYYNYEYAVEWSGSIFLTPGTYRFQTQSDDATGLWIGDSVANPLIAGRDQAKGASDNTVINNNGGHGEDIRNSDGNNNVTFVAAKAGYYPFLVRGTQGGGGHGFMVDWDAGGSAGGYVPIPIDRLFRPVGSMLTISSLAGSGAVELSGGTLIIDKGEGVALFAGSIADGLGNPTGGSLLKTGTGTQVLSGTGTYTGGTTVEAGTLQIGSSTALPAGGALTIGAGGTVVLSSGLSAGAAGTSQSAAPVPEPGTFVLLAAAMIAGLALWLRRWTRK